MRTEQFNNREVRRADYSHWRRDHESWETDVSRWQADHQHALSELERVAEFVVAHGEALRRHTVNLEAHRQSFDVLSNAGPDAPVAQRTVEGFAQSHRQLSERHDRIKRHHENAISHLRALAESLRAAV